MPSWLCPRPTPPTLSPSPCVLAVLQCRLLTAPKAWQCWCVHGEASLSQGGQVEAPLVAKRTKTVNKHCSQHKEAGGRRQHDGTPLSLFVNLSVLVLVLASESCRSTQQALVHDIAVQLVQQHRWVSAEVNTHQERGHWGGGCGAQPHSSL